MFLAGIATWAVLAQPCVYCFILPRASEHHFPTKLASLPRTFLRASLPPMLFGASLPGMLFPASLLEMF